MTISKPIIGAHVSAAGGIDKAPKRAADIGCNAVQIFTSSPRTWQPANPATIPAQEFLHQSQLHGIETNAIHTIYLVNLASDKPELVTKSQSILIADLKIAALINSVGVVVHLGSHQGRGYQAMRAQLITSIKEILDQTPDNAKLLIENSAGQKGKIASDLSEIQDLITAVDSPRLGWCLDTCHAFAAGYGLATSYQSQATKQSLSAGTGSDLIPKPSVVASSDIQSEPLELFEPVPPVKNIFTEIDKLELWTSLACVHINDSRDPFGSGRDRHDNLGYGLISPTVFQSFVREPQIAKLPLFLEVPGLDNHGPDKANVDLLKAWLQPTD